MEFIKKLVETNDSEKVKTLMPFDEDTSYRGFNHIKIGDVSLSIQASYGHYCTPRKTLKDLNEYSTMEFALIRNRGFVYVADVLPSFTELEEIKKYEDTVYAYVPVELIEKLYQELKSKK